MISDLQTPHHIGHYSSHAVSSAESLLSNVESLVGVGQGIRWFLCLLEQKVEYTNQLQKTRYTKDGHTSLAEHSTLLGRNKQHKRIGREGTTRHICIVVANTRLDIPESSFCAD